MFVRFVLSVNLAALKCVDQSRVVLRPIGEEEGGDEDWSDEENEEVSTRRPVQRRVTVADAGGANEGFPRRDAATIGNKRGKRASRYPIYRSLMPSLQERELSSWRGNSEGLWNGDSKQHYSRCLKISRNFPMENAQRH